MNKNTLVFILLSLIFGLGAVYMARNWIADNRPQENVTGMVKVITVNSNLNPGTTLEPKHLNEKFVPEAMVPKGALTDRAQATDMLVKNPLYSGDIIRQQRLVKKGEGSSLASLIPKNKRAVSIRVNDIVGVSGFILPGDRVDVLTTYRERGAETATELVLSNIKILAIDQRASNDENKPQVVRAVTLEVDIKQAEVLMSAQSKGAIQLALRNPHENGGEPKVASHQTQQPQPMVMTTAVPKSIKETRKTKNGIQPPKLVDHKVQVIRVVATETVKVKGTE
ncbi:Flp pilus assembly protein CpaB [Thalassotalea mangrovi]|uniref:Flp pilus assembly protein CpaB n=1 Tax=Thalassotalea mangrovi TaxID=2572245 RepID=A0A4U1B383_9GAMM|nr:Flp pilus assembly protein CpaB [Thalassotalea mangrovi]TKB44226.1 Flp pilus assembly protein CpaB [Thalassotalea mangrovi]